MNEHQIEQFRASLEGLRETASESIADSVARREVDVVLLAVLAAFSRVFGPKGKPYGKAGNRAREASGVLGENPPGSERVDENGAGEKGGGV